MSLLFKKVTLARTIDMYFKSYSFPDPWKLATAVMWSCQYITSTLFCLGRVYECIQSIYF